MALLQFVSFMVDGHLYGLDIRLVKEVNPNTNITPVPRSPKHIRGVVNIRGQVVLVTDIGVIFGGSFRPITPDSHIIILKTSQEICRVAGTEHIQDERFGDKPTSFVVDQIGDVVSSEEKEIDPPPMHLDRTNAKFFQGVLRLETGILSILHAAEMLT